MSVMNAAAVSEALRVFARRIKHLRPISWTDPERYYSERSEIANDANRLADLIAKNSGIPPTPALAHPLTIEREDRGRHSRRGVRVGRGHQRKSRNHPGHCTHNRAVRLSRLSRSDLVRLAHRDQILIKA